jgi:hypothetical protein
MRIKIGWAFIALSLTWACSKENSKLEIETASINDDVWQLMEETKNNKESSYPLTVKGDFDNDGTEETLLRNDFYIFEDGWAFRAYSYSVINDEGAVVNTLKNRAGSLFAGAASPYTQNNDSISIFLRGYAIIQNELELNLKSDKHQLIFKKVQTIDRDEVKNAPLEPENNGDLAFKTWRMKYETGFEAKPDIFYPVERTGDFDGDGTDETVTRDDYYVFDIPWCYTAFISTIVNDTGADTLSLRNNNGTLQIKHINYFVFNKARDTIHFNGNAYAYSNNGENIMLKRGNYEAMFESVPAINPEHIKAMYEDDSW